MKTTGIKTITKNLSVGQTVSYAAGGLAMNLTNLLISMWLVRRYVPDEKNALVPAFALGLFVVLGRVMDAVSDPIVGYLSDNLHSKHGRRRPFIAWGLIPFAILSFAIWNPPIGWGPWWTGLYLFLVLQLFFLFYTVVVGPYLALIPELSSDRGERINITTVQAIFMMIGTLLFGGTGWILEHGGWLTLGAVVAALTVLSFLPTLLAIRERPPPPPPEAEAERDKPKLLASSLSTFRNRPFLHVAISTACYWFGLSVMLLILQGWVFSYLDLPDGATTTIMMPFLGMNLVFFFVFNVLSKRFGKYRMFLVTLLGTAATFPLLLLVGSLPFGDKLTQTAVVMGIIGIPVAGFLMLPYALLADVLDYDAEQTGRRREAIYIGVQAIFQKTAIGLATVAYLWLAFLDGATKPTESNLKLLAVVAAAACALGIATFAKYPLRETEAKSP